MKIKKFNEMFNEKFDYERIVRILKKTYGWGMGILTYIDDFESNSEYFKDPQSDDDYIEQFNIYLSDKRVNRERGKFNNITNIKLGKWKLSTQVDNPVSIYNKLY